MTGPLFLRDVLDVGEEEGGCCDMKDIVMVAAKTLFIGVSMLKLRVAIPISLQTR